MLHSPQRDSILSSSHIHLDHCPSSRLRNLFGKPHLRIHMDHTRDSRPRHLLGMSHGKNLNYLLKHTNEHTHGSNTQNVVDIFF